MIRDLIIVISWLWLLWVMLSIPQGVLLVLSLVVYGNARDLMKMR